MQMNEKAQDNPRGWLQYWVDGSAIIEKCLTRATDAAHEDAPFGMGDADARIWHEAQANAYQHALEMMGVPTLSGPAIRAYTTALTGDAAGVVDARALPDLTTFARELLVDLSDDREPDTQADVAKIVAAFEDIIATALTAQAERIAELERVTRLALVDQVDFLHECRRFANEASDPDVSSIRHIRADRVEERLKIMQGAVAARRARGGE